MDIVILFWEKCVTFIFVALTGPPHQMHFMASKRPAEEFGAGADNIR